MKDENTSDTTLNDVEIQSTYGTILTVSHVENGKTRVWVDCVKRTDNTWNPRMLTHDDFTGGLFCEHDLYFFGWFVVENAIIPEFGGLYPMEPFLRYGGDCVEEELSRTEEKLQRKHIVVKPQSAQQIEDGLPQKLGEKDGKQ